MIEAPNKIDLSPTVTAEKDIVIKTSGKECVFSNTILKFIEVSILSSKN